MFANLFLFFFSPSLSLSLYTPLSYSLSLNSFSLTVSLSYYPSLLLSLSLSLSFSLSLSLLIAMTGRVPFLPLFEARLQFPIMYFFGPLNALRGIARAQPSSQPGVVAESTLAQYIGTGDNI
jgi:hypothetical protein